MPFVPFDDHGESIGIAEMTIENGADRVALYGSLTIHRDHEGLANARALRTIVAAIIDRLDAHFSQIE